MGCLLGSIRRPCGPPSQVVPLNFTPCTMMNRTHWYDEPHQPTRNFRPHSPRPGPPLCPSAGALNPTHSFSHYPHNNGVPAGLPGLNWQLLPLTHRSSTYTAACKPPDQQQNKQQNLPRIHYQVSTYAHNSHTPASVAIAPLTRHRQSINAHHAVASSLTRTRSLDRHRSTSPPPS